MTLELIIFLIVAAIAIFAAAFMLVSRNAVHAALFLVTNMICLSFFYLILNAPFLAMVQITVYAGAIMVLFMFVIMLLGAEKLGELPTKYKWLPLVGVGLASVFLILAYFAIVQGNIGALKPVAKAPEIRVVHVGFNTPAVDVYLNNEKLVGGLSYQKHTDFKAVPAGDYNLLVFTAKPDGSAIDPAKDSPALASSVSLKPDTHLTIVATADRLITVPEDLTTLRKDDIFRYTVVNALPGTKPINFIAVDPANPNPAPEERAKYLQILAPALRYGEVSKTTELTAKSYKVAWEIDNQRVNVAEPFVSKENYAALVILYPEVVPGSNPPRFEPDDLNLVDRAIPSFGGPTNIGEALFTVYLLPFELVSLLLLVAMVGAIILTREDSVRRERKRVVVSTTANVRRLNQSAKPTGAITVATVEKNAESSAD